MYSGQQNRCEIGTIKRDIPLFSGRNSFRVVLQHRQDFNVSVQHLRAGDKLMYGSPLGLTYLLLDVVLLPLGSIMGKDHELM